MSAGHDDLIDSDTRQPKELLRRLARHGLIATLTDRMPRRSTRPVAR